jgi:hypothetical protein
MTEVMNLEGWEIGLRFNIEDLEPEVAMAIFGRPVYLAWLRDKDNVQPGTMVVKSIDRDQGLITLVPAAEGATKAPDEDFR